MNCKSCGQEVGNVIGKCTNCQLAEKALDKFDADTLDNFLYYYYGKKLVEQVKKDVKETSKKMSNQVTNIINSN